MYLMIHCDTGTLQPSERKSDLRVIKKGYKSIFGVARKKPVDQYLSTNGPVAQRLEQGTHNPLVLGSNPSGPTING